MTDHVSGDTQKKSPEVQKKPEGQKVTQVEQRKVHWKKESIERRKQFLVKAKCDPESINSASSDELVNFCLIVEGLMAGQLPLKVAGEPVKQTPPSENLDFKQFMMMMLHRDEQRAEAAELERKARLEATELERKARLEATELDRKARLEIAERKEKAAELDRKARLEEAKLDKEAAERKEKIMIEQARLDRAAMLEATEKKEKAMTEMIKEMSNRNIDRDRADRQDRQEKINSKESKIKSFGVMLKGVLTKMPEKIEDVPTYFVMVDNTFQELSVPEELKVTLLKPFLTEKALKAMTNLPVEERTQYREFRAAMLREFALTPSKYKDFFWSAIKSAGETYVQYATRLDTLLTYYLNSRDVDDFVKMKALIVSDKMKSDFPTYITREVNRMENVAFLPTPHELGKFVDKCVNSQDNIKAMEKSSKNTSQSSNKGRDGNNGKVVRLCYNCNSPDHLSTDPVCPGKHVDKSGGLMTTNNKHSNTPQVHKNEISGKKNDFTNRNGWRDKSAFPCYYCGNKHHGWNDCDERKKLPLIPCKTCNRKNHCTSNHKDVRVNRVQIKDVILNDIVDPESDVEKLFTVGSDKPVCNCGVNFVSYQNVTPDTDLNLDDCVSDRMKCKKDREVVHVPTEPINVKIGNKWVKCIVDTGTDITVLSTSVVDKSLLSSAKAKVSLTSAFGNNVQAVYANIPMSVERPDGFSSGQLLITCAVTDKLGSHGLITPYDYLHMVESDNVEGFIPEVAFLNGTNYLAQENIAQLINEQGRDESERISNISSALELKVINSNNSNDIYETTHVDNTGVSEVEDVTVVNKVTKHDTGPIDEVPLGAAERSMVMHDEIVKLQNEDLSLASCRNMAKTKKSEFFIRELDKLLYRKTQMFGFQVYQLVVPESKRLEIMQLAHDSIYGGHFAAKKTLQRIQTNFYWPTMKTDVTKYTQSCKDCQMRRRVTVFDRVPIAAVVRPPSFGDTISVDIVGPLEPASARGHKYILCAVDQATRWAEIVCLKSISSKNTCNALLKIFCKIGFPKVIVSDNGSNFVSALTKEFYNQLGVELRTSCPYHPEANAVVERFIQSLKKLIYQVVSSDKSREWDTKMDQVLWAYRSTPHSTTGISPYQMVYGKVPRGILSILRDNMTGLQTVHPGVSGTVKDYCDKMLKDLKISHDLAEINCEKAQKQYVTHYNLRSKDKSFEPGNQVLVLFPDSTNKLISKFQGPAIIRTKLNDYAYLVEMPDGAVRRLHANKLRLYIPRVQSVGVVFDDEEDFGDIPCYSSVVENDADIDFSCIDLSHLDCRQQEQIKQLITKHKSVFSEKPGRCVVGEHKIELIQGFIPKKKPPYRVPESLKAEIEKQTESLLKDGLISETTSAWAHPIVCVAKPDGSIRICVNYKDVNSFTIPDRYPMVRIDDLLQKVGKSSFISTLDNTSGYWQIPVHPGSRDKTAFVTHRGSYQWNVLSFGLKNAGATFQKTVNHILEPHSLYASAYIDDTSVHSGTWEEHLKHLDSVISAFGKAGMTLRLKKCKFGMPTVKYVGHMIGSGAIEADKSKISAILDIPMPTTKKLIRSFVGMANYYRDYIPNLSTLLILLTNLTKNKLPNKVQINENVAQAFEKIKQALCSSRVLRTARFDRDFIIQTDASDYAVGACLSQLDDDGSEHPIAFASSKLSDTQCRWSTIEKESYAIIFALKKFDHYIFGHHSVIVFSDHNPLHFLVDATPRSSKLTRWMLALQRYNITIEHRPGAKNANCDALSRL